MYLLIFYFHSKIRWNNKISLMMRSFYLEDYHKIFFDDSFVFQNPWELYASYFMEQILVCAITICQYYQILTLLYSDKWTQVVVIK